MKIKKPKFKLVRLIIESVARMIKMVREKISQSLRLELMLIFAISLVGAMFIYGQSDYYLSKLNMRPYISYTNGMHEIDYESRRIIDVMSNQKLMSSQNLTAVLENKSIIMNQSKQVKDNTEVENAKKILIDFLDSEAKFNNVKILITDLEGKVIYKSENATAEQVDLHSIITNAMDMRIDKYMDKPGEFFSFYPIKITDDLKDFKGYIIVGGIPKGTINYSSQGDSLLSVLIGFIGFIILFFIFTRGKMKYIEELANGLLEISKGNLDFRVKKKSSDELGSLADNINYMAKELKTKIEEERSAERTKNELITNVSHDLRTPLTSIMGYLKLLKDKRYDTTQQAEDYLDVVYLKSERLKSLIEDLFEYTKLTSGSLPLNTEIVSLNELIGQLIDELVPIGEESNLTFLVNIPEENVKADIDVDKIVRVFENLIMNAIKYSIKPGEIKVSMNYSQEWVTVRIDNKTENISKEDLPNLFERFYRVEKSRSSITGGSGLGLAIAKNIVELHEGEIWADFEGDEISLFIKLKIVRV